MGFSQVKIGAILSYGAIAFNLIAGLLYTPWMVSVIGDNQYGLYTLAISVVTIFLNDFGIGSAVSRFLSKYLATNDYEKASSFLGLSYQIFTLLAVAMGVILFCVYINIDFIYASLSSDEIDVLRTLFIVIACYSVCSFPFMPQNGILISNERFIFLKACNLLQKMTTVGLIVFALLAGLDVIAMVLANAVGQAIFIFVKYFYIKKVIQLKPVFSAVSIGKLKEVFLYSGWVTLSEIAQRFIFSIMPSILGIVLGSVEIAIFGLAASLEGYLYTVGDALNGLFMPRIATYSIRDDKDDLYLSLMIKVGRIQICIVGFIVICFASIGLDFVNCWLGEGYDLVYWCALCFFVPALTYAPQAVALQIVLIENRVREKALLYVAMAIVNIVLGVALSVCFGVVGSAIAVLVAYLVRNIGLDYIYSQKLGIRMGLFYRRVYIKWLMPAVVLTLILQGVKAAFVGSGWLYFLFLVCVGGLAYVFTLAVFSLSREERSRIVSRLLR